MKTVPLVLAGVLSVLPFAARSVEAERTVGSVTIEMNNKSTSRSFPVELWYQPVPGAKAEAVSFRLPLRPIMIARGADAHRDVAKRPLIVISHGNWGSRYSQGWLALRLVNAGYVVLSTSHPGTLGDDQTIAGRYRLWDRSTDVSFALDQILREPKWAALIDERQIGFIGHSFGGWTGVSLAGGKYDPVRQRAFCDKAAKKDFYCDGTLKDDISSVQAADAEESVRDARIKAYYIMATGPGQGFSEELVEIDQRPLRRGHRAIR